MKKNIILLTAGVIGGLGYYLYNKNKKEKKVIVEDERSLARKNNDYIVYSDDLDYVNPKEEMFV